MGGREVAGKFKELSKWNIIDADAQANPLTSFSLPEAVSGVSLNEIYKDRLATDTFTAGDNVAHYLLVSPVGALTMWHTDFSATSAFYFLAKGCKIFYLVRPTPNNKKLWSEFTAQERRDIFFGGCASLDDGGCQKIVLTEREAICLPAGMMHCVETIGTSVAFG